MKNNKRDKFLSEKMGIVWHDFIHGSFDNFYCATCDFSCCSDSYEIVYHLNYDFSTWNGFGKLWEWSKTQDIWYNISELLGQCDGHCLIQPDELANTVYEMLGGGDEKSVL